MTGIENHETGPIHRAITLLQGRMPMLESDIKPLYNYIQRHLRRKFSFDNNDIYDVTQMTIMSLLQTHAIFRGNTELSAIAYVKAAAFHKGIDYLETKKRETCTFIDDILHPNDDQPTSGMTTEDISEEDVFDQCFSKFPKILTILKPAEVKVIKLLAQGFKQKEISKVLGVSASYISTVIKSARNKIRPIRHRLLE